ncbi:sigma-54-dependent transcriptional regulator [Thermosulfurimonas dismutans]|uniref:Sigma-54 dependent transcriptional regulator/response regulator n=1 Tax=Thermosulfurimonas dismutans TaxID=999894 RepID=A0A179D5R3_9BACT|nr:sigma-54 dependent transcriptional regulator [Thermosulfurimonas dismutans]OAQ21435.1 sigma-54 dependent transcriptional regulator/response regulator [Thermosulfurimonas dismutans]
MPKATVLLVDDEPQMVRLLQKILKPLSELRLEIALSGEEALEKVYRLLPEVVVSDIKMPGMDGLELLERIRERDSTISVILITGYGTIEMAVEAIKKGAYDFVNKPFDKDHFRHLVKRALERTQLLRENLRLRSAEESWWESLGIIGQSPVFRELMAMVEQVARCDIAVLIRGESGTGKEQIARAIHHLSDRREKKMVAVNCAAIPENILESELFGYVKGAFTGAERDHPGLFQEAHGSTIFLDEIGDMPLNLQVKLLRALQDGEVRPLGATCPVKVEVRVIASTNQDLEEKIAAGQFREDLYYRLNEVTLWVPPLRERGEDILLLARHFLQKYAKEYQREDLDFSPEALEFLMRHPWKGNVRELKNAVKRAVLLAKGSAITPEDLRDSLRDFYKPRPSEAIFHKPYHQAKKEVLEQFARRYLEGLLRSTRGNVTQAARLAGLERQSFQRLLRQYGISAEDFRSETSM